jgi:hypothetical protein
MKILCAASSDIAENYYFLTIGYTKGALLF